MQFLLEKNVIFAGIKFREFREFTHFHNFCENQISRFFQKLAKFAKINFLKADNLTLRGDEKEELNDVRPMPALEGEEEKVKEVTGIKILPPNKLLTTLPVQRKTGNNSSKLKNEITKIVYLLLSTQ